MASDEQRGGRYQTMSIQEALDMMQRDTASLRNHVVALIELDKITLRAFLDLGMIEQPKLIEALRELERRQTNSETASIFQSLIHSFEASHGQPAKPEREPYLKLVQIMPEKLDTKPEDDSSN